MAFTDDIKGQNTQLYPVVVIDGVYYSTNNVTIDGNYCKPILMNIPSIKESIDIESRKFKISNVSLEFNNFPFKGERFSDQLSASSLINKEAIIYYKSPSTNTINEMYELFRGTIRRISHDDEKVRVDLEDLTEKEAHIELPRQTPPPSEFLPEKYANKPVPMVYGHVEKSPVLPYYSYTEEIVDDSDEEESVLEYRLKIDNEPILGEVEETIKIGNADFVKSALFFHENDSYYNVHRTNAEISEPTNSGISNFRHEGTSIVFDIDTESQNIDSQPELDNDFSKGRLRIHQVRGFSKIETQDLYNGGNGSGINQGELFFDESTGIGRIYGTIDLRTFISGQGDDQRTTDYSYGYFKCILEPSSTPNNLSTEVNSDGVQVPVPTITRVLLDILHYNFSSTSNSPDGITENTITNAPGSESSYPIGGQLSGKHTKWAVWTGNAPIISSDEFYQIGQFSNSGYSGANTFNNIGGDDTLDVKLAFPTPSSFESINIGIAPHRFLISSIITSILYDDDDQVFNVDTTLNNGFIVQTYFVDGVADKDYYANINGRINTFDHPFLTDGDSSDAELYDEFVEASFIQNPIDIIYDILRSELGLTREQINEDDYEEARTEHFYWKFAFTLNKKMNSKKLIEDIAKSTKCFPKFRNDGTFGFNTIKDSYNTSDYDDAHLIKQSDVISYSFKKTKPEQIYRQVDVQYNMDYAQDSLLSRTALQNNGASDFYGIESPDDAYLEFESPYIRDEQTAVNLRDFLAAHYKNDHLIFNLKLPLQYIDLEIGELVKFTELFQGLKAYGIDYRLMYPQDSYNIFYPLFMITSITKNLDSVSIECMQLHALTDFGENTILEITQFNSQLNISDSDPLTITPFIPESEGEILGENLWTNPDFTDSSFSAIQIDVVDDEIVIDGGSFNLYGSEILSADNPDNILEEGKVYRYEFEITESTTTASFFGIKVFPEQSGSPYVNEVGVYSFDLEKQTYGAQNLNVLRLLFYGFRGKIKNNISVREVIQEAPPFDGGLIVNDDNAWTLPTAGEGEAYVENGVLIFNEAIFQGGSSLKYLHQEELERGAIYRVRFEIFDYIKGHFRLSVRNAVTLPRAEGNGEYEYFVECSQNGQNYSYTYVGNPSSTANVYSTFKVRNISIHKVENDESVLVSRNRFKIDDLIQEQELYTEDSKYDLKDLKDME